MNLLKSLDKVNLLKSLDRDIYAISSGNLTVLSNFHWNYKVLSLNILELSILGEKWYLTALILDVVPVEI